MNQSEISAALENLTIDVIKGAMRHIVDNGERKLIALREKPSMNPNYLYGYQAAILDAVDMLSSWLKQTDEE